MHGTLELPNGDVIDLFPDGELPPHAEDPDDSGSIEDTEFPDESR